MKMWNDERGFGFVTPAGGGEDVFVHRSAIGEGVALSTGANVTYNESMDDKKNKPRALDVQLGGGGAGDAGRSKASSGAAFGVSQGPASRHHIVGSFCEWTIARQPMDACDGGALVKHRVVIRSDAQPGKNDPKLRREEFQIVGDGTWEKRVYPAGGNNEEVVVLTPGAAPSPAASGQGKGHGRNWAVEGRAGSAFDIVFDPDTRTVACEQAFKEESRGR